MIITACIPEQDIAFFDHLRRDHFPSARNFLNAHLTLFHNVSDRHLAEIQDILVAVAARFPKLSATAIGVRHLGKGVAFDVECQDLVSLRQVLRKRFEAWLVPQDLQGWRPHITIQNGVSRAVADRLFDETRASFKPMKLAVIGLDLWHYRGGPWLLEEGIKFNGHTINDRLIED